MLGEMYVPKGYALETAQAVLDVKDVMAVNVAWGCTHCCTYPCYVPRFMHSTVEEAQKIHLPKLSPAKLVAAQLAKKPAPAGVFASFLTDPLLEDNLVNTMGLVNELHLTAPATRVAVLSKTDDLDLLPSYSTMRYGSTIVSLDKKFYKQYEPYAASPERRIMVLKELKKIRDEYVFVSMEPYPTSEIVQQSLDELIYNLSFVDFIVFGKWNYNTQTSTAAAKAEYTELVDRFRDLCNVYGIRYHIKSETLKFIGELP
jgi:DNA repair photolyase